ncbi:MAG: hypothetical protein IIW08_11270 [Clostridia bacterium]|nr:hypothetical protein [Clostridia bacterium]
MSEIDPRVSEGIEALKNLLKVSDKKQSGEETVNHLVEEIGSIRSIYESTREDLQNLHGLSRVSGEVIDLVDDLARCTLRDELGPKPVIQHYDKASKYFCAVMFGRQIEYCYLLLLDRRGKLIKCPLMQTGTIDRSAVYAREVALKALRGKAAYCVLSHNHPGGHMEPSREDIQMTYSVKDALNAAGIILLDHIIVSDHKAISVRSLGFPPEKVWQNQRKNDRIIEKWFESSEVQTSGGK